MFLRACDSKMCSSCFRRFEWSIIFPLSFCFILITRLKASFIDTHGYFDRYDSCIKIFIYFNSSMGLSCILVSYFTFVSIEFWSCLLQNSHITLCMTCSGSDWTFWFYWYSRWSLLCISCPDRSYRCILCWDPSIGLLCLWIFYLPCLIILYPLMSFPPHIHRIFALSVKLRPYLPCRCRLFWSILSQTWTLLAHMNFKMNSCWNTLCLYPSLFLGIFLCLWNPPVHFLFPFSLP